MSDKFDKEALIKHAFNVEISKHCVLWMEVYLINVRIECAKYWINYWSFLLISVYLHDQRYAQRMDQSRQYDDLRGEWIQVRIEYAHNFAVKYRTPERSQTSRRFQRRISRTSVTRLVILARLSFNTVAKTSIHNLPLPNATANLVVIFITEA